jgi:ankyrin repeat protein
VDVVRLLLAAGADPNARELSMGGTPLHVAAHSGHLDVARLLVEADADLAACTSRDGATPLQLAVSRGHHHVVEYLIAVAPKDEAPSDAEDKA